MVGMKLSCEEPKTFDTFANFDGIVDILLKDRVVKAIISKDQTPLASLKDFKNNYTSSFVT